MSLVVFWGTSVFRTAAEDLKSPSEPDHLQRNRDPGVDGITILDPVWVLQDPSINFMDAIGTSAGGGPTLLENES